MGCEGVQNGMGCKHAKKKKHRSTKRMHLPLDCSSYAITLAMHFESLQ